MLKILSETNLGVYRTKCNITVDLIELFSMKIKSTEHFKKPCQIHVFDT